MLKCARTFLSSMKFRLSKRILAAVMAAVASVSFSSVGTATLGAAAFGFTVQQAAAEEAASTTVAPAEGTEFTAEEDELVVDLNEENKEKEEESKEEEQKVKYEPKTKRFLPCTMTQGEAVRFAENFGGGKGTLEDMLWSADIANGSGDTAAMIPAAESAAQATATGTTALPSTDMGFTTDAYGRSAAEVAKGSALEFETPKPAFAATGGALNLSTPTTGSSNASSSVATPASTAVQNHLDNGYGYYQYGTPILRQATITTPPAMLGETAPAPSEYIFSFNNGETTEYFNKVQDFYNLEVKSGDTGTIQFSSAMRGKPLTVEGDFIMTGKKFTIDTNGVDISFAQPLSNYDTDMIITGGGTITANSPAAFKTLDIQSGGIVVDTQIGVLNGITVGTAGTLVVQDGAKLILTRQITNAGAITLSTGAIIDASNLTHEAAQDLGITFEGADPEHKPSEDGSGFLHGEPGTQWKIATGGGGVTVQGTGTDVPQLVVGSLSFDISEDGIIHHEETDYSLWFQNGGTSPKLSEIILATPDNKVSIMVNKGETANTTIMVDGMISEDNPVLVTRGTNAIINLIAEDYDDPAAIGTLKIYDSANVAISGWSGVDNRLTNAVFIGSGIELHTTYLLDVNEFDPMNITVESASSATIDADIVSPYGYFVGKDFTRQCISEDHPGTISGTIDFESGEYHLQGALTMGEGHKIDMREAYGTTYFYSATRETITGDTGTVRDVVFQEEFVHLTMSEQGALLLQDESVFLASSVSDDSVLIEDGSNLDTTRKLDSAAYSSYDLGGSWYYDLVDENQDWIDPNTLEKYEVNGTVEIHSSVDTGKATLTSIGETAGHYTTRNKNFTVANAQITVNDMLNEYETYEGGKNNTTISNVLTGDSVTNDKASHGTVTLDNKNSNDYVKLWAKEGDIAITNNVSVTAETVQIGAGREVSVSSLEELRGDGSLTVTELLKADGGSTKDGVGSASKVKADVVLIEGATLDVSKADGVGGLDLTGTLTINKGAMLSEGDLAQIFQMEIGAMYDLAFDVTRFNNNTGAITWDSDNRIDASTLFGDEQFWEGEYYVCYSGNGVKGGNGNNVGTVYLYKATPEPTTGTLSLLALCALAARRRRK